MSTASDIEWLEATRRFWGAETPFEAKYRRICTDPIVDAADDEDVLRRQWEKRTRDELAMLLRGIPIQDDWTCLEIGCGVGRLLEPISKKCRKAIGVDISDRMIRFASQYLDGVANVELHVNDGRSLSMIPDASIDWVYSHLAFQHMTLPEVVACNLSECARVLKPGAYLRLQTCREAAMPLAERAKNVVRWLLGRERYNASRSWVWRPGREVRFSGVTYHPGHWRRLLREHGFRVESMARGLGHSYWLWMTCRKR